jgi:hypothetical protein
LTNSTDGVLTNDVDGGKNAVATLLTETVDEGLLGGVHTRSGIFGSVLLAFFLFADLAADTGDAEEEVADELDGAVRVKQSVSKKRKERKKRRKIRTFDEYATPRRRHPARAREGEAR